MKWTDELIKSELLKCIDILGIERMPTASELKSLGRNDLHCIVGRTKRYSGWANELNLNVKRSETVTGQYWEQFMYDFLTKYEYEVERMTTKHPYDLLIDGSVKVDVKVANPYLLNGQYRTHTFSLSKEKPTCDIYICVALDEEGKRERTLIIPSHHVQMKMLNIGTVSKYNKYHNDWLTLYKYSKFFKSIN